LSDKGIDAIYSSPYRRAYDTVLPFALGVGLPIHVVEDFREREFDVWDDDFPPIAKQLWADFSTAPSNGGECFADVQTRNIMALNQVLAESDGHNIVIGTHGLALSTIINHFDPSFGLVDFMVMVAKMPWIVKMQFDGNVCTGIEMFDLY